MGQFSVSKAWYLIAMVELQIHHATLSKVNGNMPSIVARLSDRICEGNGFVGSVTFDLSKFIVLLCGKVFKKHEVIVDTETV